MYSCIPFSICVNLFLSCQLELLSSKNQKTIWVLQKMLQTVCLWIQLILSCVIGKSTLCYICKINVRHKNLSSLTKKGRNDVQILPNEVNWVFTKSTRTFDSKSLQIETGNLSRRSHGSIKIILYMIDAMNTKTFGRKSKDIYASKFDYLTLYA